jgi:fucose 4-O-acetylase-like acetyltransferase
MARMTAAQIDAATPADRNRYADALRLGSIAVVVLGHWLLAVLTVSDDGGIAADHLLGVAPWTQWLTWIFQVMPLFFFVGGYANAMAWASARRRGDGWAGWVRSRARRLLRPIVPVLALWLPLAAALAALGVPADLLRIGTQVVIVPMWFLAAYLVVVAFVPVTAAAHRRFGLGALAALVLLAAAVDAAHLAGVPLIGWTNFLWVWAAVHQAGYLWADQRDGTRSLLPSSVVGALALAAAGFAALALLTTVAGYPLSMVGVDGAARTNNSPPTIALIALGAAQVGLALAARGPAERFLARPSAWAAVVKAGTVTMTVYLWHMTAMIAGAALLIPTGIWPTRGVDGLWWAQRPLWFALLGVILVGLVAVFGRFEHAGAPRPRSSRVRTGLGVVATTAGLGLLVVGGLHTEGAPLGLPLVRSGVLVLGLGALGVLRPRARREAELGLAA